MGAPHFLVLDDDLRITRYVERALTPFGVTVATHSVSDAIAALEARRTWAALCVDLVLPDGSGFDVLEAAQDGGLCVPSLVMTGHAHEAAINRAYDLGARILCKPFSTPRMESFAREVVDRDRSPAGKRTAVVDAWKARYDLTRTEAALLRDAVAGASRDELADIWGIMPSTLATHVKNIIQKTGDGSLAGAIQRVLREGMGK